MDAMRKKVKMDMLKHLKKLMHDDMNEGMGDKLGSKEKVTVIADDKEGLEEGLSKAQEILEKRKSMFSEMSDMDEDHDEESEEMPKMSEDAMADDIKEDMKEKKDDEDTVSDSLKNLLKKRLKK